MGTAAEYGQTERDAWAPVAIDLHEWRCRLGPLAVLIAQTNARRVGFIGYSTAGRIDLLFVAPDWTRRGIGSLLYKAAEAALSGAGVAYISTAASLTARPFFRAHGFRVVRNERCSSRGVALGRHIMRKRLVDPDRQAFG
mgnify:CR=1 FL=1